MPVALAVALLFLSSLAAATLAPLPPGGPVPPSPARVPLSASSGGAESLARPDASALGAVLSTTDLVANQLYPGDQVPAVQDDPYSVVFDPGNGNLYVRGELGTAANVVNATTDRVLTTIGLPADQNPYILAPTLVPDPLTGDLFAMNFNEGNISVINGTTERVTGTFGSGLAPASGVVDPANGYLYVSDWNDDNVSVFNGTTDALVTTLPAGTHPGALLFDPTSSEVFVANYGSGNVTVIDTATNTWMKNIPTGAPLTYPLELALDVQDNEVDVGSETTYNLTVISASSLTVVAHPYVSYDSDGLAWAPRQDQLFVENGGEGNVTVFNQSEDDRVVANISTGSAPEGIAFDPVDQDVYVLNSETPNVTVIDPAMDRIVASVATNDGDDYGVAVDPSDGNVFVASEGTYTGSIRGFQANLTVIADGTNEPIASVPLEVFPVGLTYDAGAQEVVAADVAGQDVYRIDPATDLSVGTAPTGFSWSSAYDSATGDLWVLNWGSYNLTVLNPTFQSIANLSVGSGPSGIAFDSANGDVYVPDNAAGDVWVFNGATRAYSTTIPVLAGADLSAIVYDPHNQELYVADQTGENLTIINGSSQRTVGSIPVGAATLSLAFDSTNDTIWAANDGNFTVIGDSTNRSVANLTDTYAEGRVAFDAATNVLYDASNFESTVLAIGASNYSVLGTLYLGENFYSTGIAYDPANAVTYVSSSAAGIVSEIGQPKATYPVDFVESGLPTGTVWGVRLNGTLNSSAATTIGFRLTNYTYDWTIGSFSGYDPNVTSGSVTVDGMARTIDVGFTASVTASYAITFVESGLTAGSSWGVSLEGSFNSSTTSSVGFTDPDGTYSFSVPPVTGYGATPSSGSVTVNGRAVTQNISFAPGANVLSVTLTVSPASISLGGETNFSAVTSGGTPPIQYVYSGLPSGCTSSSVPTLACMPNVTGTFPVTVTVTDDLGHTAQANATLTVTSGTTSSPPPNSGSSTWLWLLLLVIVVAILVLVYLVLRRRRKDAAPRTPRSAAAPPPAPPPPSPPPK